MPRIHVCPLALIAETVTRAGASHLVTLINDGTAVERPPAIAAERHLRLGINDIVEPMEGMVLPAEEHIDELLGFVRGWDRANPMVVHCFAGISRSTAATYIALCALAPERSEGDIARRLRAASPIATPNRLMVRLADRMLGRGGRMVAAIEEIGPGTLAMEGIPFHLALSD